MQIAMLPWPTRRALEHIIWMPHAHTHGLGGASAPGSPHFPLLRVWLQRGEVVALHRSAEMDSSWVVAMMKHSL